MEPLLMRIGQMYEFEEIRRLAAEVVARVEPSILCPPLLCAMESQGCNDQDSAVPFKAYVLACCHACVQHGEAVLPWAARITSCACSALTCTEEHSEIRKLHLGCIDLIAMLLQAEHLANDDSAAGVTVLSSVLQMLQTVTQNQDEIQVEKLCVAAANIVTQVTKMASSAAVVASIGVHFLEPLIVTTRSEEVAVVVRAASSQALFNLVFRLSGFDANGAAGPVPAESPLEDWRARLQQLCCGLLRDSEEQIRLAALKLTGVLLAPTADT